MTPTLPHRSCHRGSIPWRPRGGARPPSRGYSVIELMVSILISLIILAGLVTLFANNSRERDEIQRANQQTENGQYALEIIGDDLREAGYLGTFDPEALTTPTADPDPCATDVASLNAALPIAVQGYDDVNSASLPLSCIGTDVKDGTDILVIRRAGICAVNQGDPTCPSQVSGAAYFQASGCNSAAELGSGNIDTYYVLDTDSTKFTLHQHDCSSAAPLYPYEVHIYFIAKDDKANDGIPTLKRVDLANGGFSSPMTIAEGVDQLQIDYGLDSLPTTTGTPAAFTADPNSYCTVVQCAFCTGTACAPDLWRNTVAAEVYVLARNTTKTPGYTDTKTYTLGTDASGNPQTYPAPNDEIKRHVYEAEFRLINISGRNTP